MESVLTLEDLYEMVKDIDPCESMIRTFNVLCPYEKNLPIWTGKEETIEDFFGQQ